MTSDQTPVQVNLRINPDIIDTLKIFGDITTIVNAVLHEYSLGTFSINKQYRGYDDGKKKHYLITIYDDKFLQMRQYYSPNSPDICLATILTTFVNDEIYDTLGWSSEQFTQSDTSLNMAYCKKIMTSLSTVTTYIKKLNIPTDRLNYILSIVSDIAEEIKNEIT